MRTSISTELRNELADIVTCQDDDGEDEEEGEDPKEEREDEEQEEDREEGKVTSITWDPLPRHRPQ